MRTHKPTHAQADWLKQIARSPLMKTYVVGDTQPRYSLQDGTTVPVTIAERLIRNGWGARPAGRVVWRRAELRPAPRPHLRGAAAMNEAVSKNAERLPRPMARPFKDNRDLTCPHGRFWSSCKRCSLRPETVKRTVGVGGESCQRLEAAFWPSRMRQIP